VRLVWGAMMFGGSSLNYRDEVVLTSTLTFFPSFK
jgi:hypothetical protein